jgi:drug/metabolite transporter (DMT)-like permease
MGVSAWASESVAARFSGTLALSRRAALASLVLANTLFAGTYVAGKIVLRSLTPVELNAARFTLAALILLPVLLHGWRRIPRDRRTLLALVQAVLLGFVLNKTFEYFGLALSTASDVALLIATESVFTVLLSWTILRERVSRAGVVALMLGLAGAYLIVERGVVPSLGGALDASRVAGDLLVVLSLLVEAAYTVTGKSALSSVPPLLFVSASIVGSLLVWIPAGAASVVHSGWPHLSLAGWLALLYMAVIATAAGYALWFRGLTALDVSAAAPTLFIQPLLGAALAVVLLHDAVTWATLLGAALIGLSLLCIVRASAGASATAAATAATVVASEPVP